ncbi:MAG: hypothetical protein J1E36_02185 [Eubacterium sp.]|nr:hypothetical protein [Eubacterium sp.]
MTKETTDRFNSFLDVINVSEGFLKISKALDGFCNWYTSNADTIASCIEGFIDFGIWGSAIKKLEDKQIVFTDDITSELAKEIYDADDVDAIVEQYYFQNFEERMSLLIDRCQQSSQVIEYQNLYSQIISAYRMTHYHLACIGLFAMLDGILADISNLITTNYKKRLNIIERKLCDNIKLSEIDRRTLCIYSTIKSFDTSILCNSDLSGNEPNSLNRHWTLHGRAKREYSKYDFLKILLYIDAIIFLSNTIKKHEKSITV